MTPNVLSMKEHRDHLGSLVYTEDQELYKTLKHSYLEGAFVGRVFVVYRATGIIAGKPNPPQILGYIKVTDFESSPDYGSEVEIENLNTSERMWVGHIPNKLYNYDLFMSVPVVLQTTYSANYEGDEVKNTLLFGVIIRALGRTEHCIDGATYALTPKRFHALYPSVELDLY